MILALLAFASLSAGAGALLQASPAQSRADSITDDILRRLRVQDSIRATRIALSHAARRDPSRRREVTEKDMATAFKDPGARILLERARIARLGQDSALTGYDAQSYQRVSAGISFAKLGRDRLVFRMEHSGRVRWQDRKSVV